MCILGSYFPKKTLKIINIFHIDVRHIYQVLNHPFKFQHKFLTNCITVHESCFHMFVQAFGSVIPHNRKRAKHFSAKILSEITHS